VINFDMPKSIEDYTHRIGRTGRAGLAVLATSFVTNEDSALFYDLKQMLANTQTFLPSELTSHPAASIRPGAVPEKKPRRETAVRAK
jgi:ATP-dependent RNA helicase DDX23/PRP28